MLKNIIFIEFVKHFGEIAQVSEFYLYPFRSSVNICGIHLAKSFVLEKTALKWNASSIDESRSSLRFDF